MIEIKPEAKKPDGITNDLVEIVQPSIEKMIYFIRDKQVLRRTEIIMVVVGLFLMYLQSRESLCWRVCYIAKWRLR
jgi:hypothetical protein